MVVAPTVPSRLNVGSGTTPGSVALLLSLLLLSLPSPPRAASATTRATIRPITKPSAAGSNQSGRSPPVAVGPCELPLSTILPWRPDAAVQTRRRPWPVAPGRSRDHEGPGAPAWRGAVAWRGAATRAEAAVAQSADQPIREPAGSAVAPRRAAAWAMTWWSGGRRCGPPRGSGVGGRGIGSAGSGGIGVGSMSGGDRATVGRGSACQRVMVASWRVLAAVTAVLGAPKGVLGVACSMLAASSRLSVVVGRVPGSGACYRSRQPVRARSRRPSSRHRGIDDVLGWGSPVINCACRRSGSHRRCVRSRWCG